MRRFEEAGLLLDHPLEELHAAGAVLRHGFIGFVRDELDRAESEPVRLDAALEDAKALLAERRDVQDAELRHVPRGDAGEGADVGGNRGRADFAAFADEAHAKRRALAQAGLGHVHVALLEDAQRQPAARKEHGVQREEREVVHPEDSSRARPRWRTSTLQSLRKASARRSTRYTERWRPPVQPIATLTELRFSRTISGSQRASRPRTSSSQRSTEGSRPRNSITSLSRPVKGRSFGS